MRRLPIPLVPILAVVAIVALLGSVTAAGAIELRNEDAQAYTVRVTSASMSQNIRLGPHAASLVVCTKSCRFHVAGVGQVRASGDDVVSIRKRKLLHRVSAKP